MFALETEARRAKEGCVRVRRVVIGFGRTEQLEDASSHDGAEHHAYVVAASVSDY